MRRAVVGLDTVAAGLEPRLLLQAVARVGDVTSAPSTIEVLLVEELFSDLVVVSSGPNRIEGTVLLSFPLEGIEVVTTEPDLPVVGVPEYEARNCIE